MLRSCCLSSMSKSRFRMWNGNIFWILGNMPGSFYIFLGILTKLLSSLMANSSSYIKLAPYCCLKKLYCYLLYSSDFSSASSPIL